MFCGVQFTEHQHRFQIEEGSLPECFEADERSESATEDILQLVSGRTLLGRVRQRHDPLFSPGQSASATVGQKLLVDQVT